MIIVESKERNDGSEPMTFIENDGLEIPTVFPPKLPDPSNFSFRCVVGKRKLKEPYVNLVQV